MKAILLAALVLVTAALGIYSSWRSDVQPHAVEAATTGDLVYRQGTYSVRLLDKPCEFDELREALQADDGMGEPHAAVIMEGARRIPGCWDRGVDEAVIRDLANHGGELPLAWFRREPRT